MRPHALSSSVSSLSSSTSSRHSSAITQTYRQASTLFLTRRLPEALSTVLPLVTQPPPETPDGVSEPSPVARASRNNRIKVWSLYLTTLNAIIELDPDEGKRAFGSQEWRALCSKVREGEIWEEVIQNGYHGVEGDVDADVVINLATLLLAHAKTQTLNQKRLEAYLAASTTPNLDLASRMATQSPRMRYSSPAKGASGTDTPRDLNARVKILELYTLHVLLRNNEWDYAREFISVSPVLDEERREAFLQALSSLQEEQQQTDEAERQKEANLRAEIEEAKRQRAEDEEKERKREEEERAKRERESTEIDYGIERRPSTSGSGSGKPRRRGSPVSKGPSDVRPRAPKKSNGRPKGKAAPSPTLASRAAMVLSNIGAAVENLGSSFKTNPMLLLRTLVFMLGMLLLFGRKDIRERLARIFGRSWNKVLTTAGMGVKVSYI